MAADVLDLEPTASDAELAAALVREAGKLAARMRTDGLVGRQKTSVSDVVTAADYAAEKFIVESLRRLRPRDSFFGEEGTDYRGDSGRTWVIDPVDGTYNFLSGLAYWCSALALTEGNVLQLGAVYQPSADELWLGGRDHPTTCNDAPVQKLSDRPLDQGSLATYVHPGTWPSEEVSSDDILAPFLALVSGAATPRILGSGSVDLAGVAGGRIGAWAQHSCPDWDWLPGRALVEAAGGRAEVVEHRGNRWHLAGNPTAVADLIRRLLAS